ncbi:DUF885 domain-containing protein [Alkalisalibacterium limincola]|uniref:DUF885 domain-containing protein n=1 Tax=Alkalisalibacterium limincola TaxID=2699169 RepID=A0A5C8KU23_9GAMM|nr:DUF885 domain-containing protein [Alkalisalibacterium limincola]TXK64926.1 DUF885 domain-containing protein [Alkalisalibacterium limincola]
MSRTSTLSLAVTLSLALCAPWATLAAGAPQGQRSSDSSVEARSPASQALHALFEADFERSLQENPLLATALGDPRYNDRLPELGPQARERQQQAVRDSLARLEAIDRGALGAADQLNYDIYLTLLEEQVERAAYRTDLMPISQRGGVHTMGDSWRQSWRPGTLKDHQDWIARLNAYGDYVDGTIALMREGIDSGWVSSRAIMQRVPPQLAAQIVDDPTRSAFYAPFRDIPGSVPADQHETLQAQAREAMVEVVLPALRRLQVFFNEEYLPATRESVAASELPAGPAFYDFLARRFTTTELSAARIHRIGLEEVARIRADMERIREEVGFEGDLQAFFHYLRTDPKFYYDSPEALLEGYQAMTRRIDPELVKVFTHFPRMPYGVVPIPEATAPDTTTAYYSRPAADGSRAGQYYVNLYRPETRPKWEMMALSLHEGVPGHHFQIALSQEMPGQPMFRRMSPFTAFVEGWGLYAERLGYDMGLYDDPYDRMGQLTYDMWRAVRLVVDTGLHAKGWSRQQAIDYFAENAPKSEHDITNEIDRYIGNPGQALAYKIGQLRLSALRERAEQRLGEEFDLRVFHDRLLADGALPLSVLEQRVDAWIEQQAAAR